MNKKEQVLEKLKKLKALAEGALKVGSIEESHNAAMKIKNLTDKYNISLLGLCILCGHACLLL